MRRFVALLLATATLPLSAATARAAAPTLVVTAPAAFTPGVPTAVRVVSLDDHGQPQPGEHVRLNESRVDGASFMPTLDVSPDDQSTGADGSATFTVTATAPTTLYAKDLDGDVTTVPVVVQSAIGLVATGAATVRTGSLPHLRLAPDSHLSRSYEASQYLALGVAVPLSQPLLLQRRPAGSAAWTTVASLADDPAAAGLPVPTTSKGTWEVRVVDPAGPGRVEADSPTVSFTTHGGLPEWMTRLDKRRKQAGLGPVVEDPALSAADLLHAKWQHTNNAIGHAETPGTRGYTTAGAKAAAQSVVSLGRDGGASAVDGWIGAPFHATCLLDPALLVVGYGQAVRSSALNCLGGLRGGNTSDVLWPRTGTAVPLELDVNANEFPDAGAHCGPGGSRVKVWGTPVLMAASTFGLASVAGATAMLTHKGKPVSSCLLDELTFRGDDGAQTSEGRQIFAERHWLVLLPRGPLRPGPYTATFTVGGQVRSTSFTIASR